MAFRDRIRSALSHGWNAFVGAEDRRVSHDYGPTYFGGRPDRPRFTYGRNERTIISSIYNRLGIDAAGIDILHVRLDEQKRYIEDIESGLNNCLTVEANTDQAARAFRQDIFMTLFEKGSVAILPVETTLNPNVTAGYDIQTMRIGYVKAWRPQQVEIEAYDERDGTRKSIWVDKKTVAIIENPLYTVMNEPNSTLQRLIRKLGMLDSMDELVSSGKLDMIIQLPYAVKSEARKADADRRRKDITDQLRSSELGIAYLDVNEKVTQLNRPIENNLLKQIEYLTDKLYGELGLTKEVMNGTADEPTMKNYHNRTIEPLIAAVVEEMRRKFLTKTARSQRQSIMAFRDPFKMVPISDLAEIADKLSRNEIVSANEMRQFMGIKPAADPKADQLLNSNMPQPNGVPGELPPSNVPTIDGEVVENDLLSRLDALELEHSAIRRQIKPAPSEQETNYQ
jgi:hypothetical protein